MDLFSDGLPAEIGGPVTLVRLAEKRVERARDTVGRVGVPGHGEGGDVGQSETAVVVAERSGSVQTVGVFEFLGQTLQKRQRLTEPHLRRKKQTRFACGSFLLQLSRSCLTLPRLSQHRDDIFLFHSSKHTSAK